MQVSHLKTETGLPTATVNFPESDFPFIRMTDYRKFGYGNYIGIEAPCDDIKHYPIENEESEKLYNKYRKKAVKDDITLVGRLARYKYQDMDIVINDCLEVQIKE
jgi:UDP-galactopyranose mutase